MSDTIEGRQPVLEALRSDRAVNRILLARDGERHGVIAEILKLARERGIPFEYVDRIALEKCASTPVHQGVLATPPRRNT